MSKKESIKSYVYFYLDFGKNASTYFVTFNKVIFLHIFSKLEDQGNKSKLEIMSWLWAITIPILHLKQHIELVGQRFLTSWMTEMTGRGQQRTGPDRQRTKKTQSWELSIHSRLAVSHSLSTLFCVSFLTINLFG